MSQPETPIGSISWTDLTVPDAQKVREFYQAVVGWKSEPVNMDGYEDFCMNLADEEKTVAGICHARGENVGLPAQWLIYITVADLAKSMRQCAELGGKVHTTESDRLCQTCQCDLVGQVRIDIVDHSFQTPFWQRSLCP